MIKLNRYNKPFIIAINIVIVLLSAFITYQIIVIAKDMQELSIEKAEISSIKYGLLNVEAWEEELVEIVDKTIRDFEFTEQSRADLKVILELLKGKSLISSGIATDWLLYSLYW